MKVQNYSSEIGDILLCRRETRYDFDTAFIATVPYVTEFGFNFPETEEFESNIRKYCIPLQLGQLSIQLRVYGDPSDWGAFNFKSTRDGGYQRLLFHVLIMCEYGIRCLLPNDSGLFSSRSHIVNLALTLTSESISASAARRTVEFEISQVVSDLLKNGTSHKCPKLCVSFFLVDYHRFLSLQSAKQTGKRKESHLSLYRYRNIIN